MLRVVLLDDETEARRNLRQLLSQICPSVMQVYANVELAYGFLI